MSLASANGATTRWLSEDFILVKLVGESCAKSKTGVAIFGAVGIGEAGTTAADFRFGSRADSSACSGNFGGRHSRAGNVSGGDFCRCNFHARQSRDFIWRIFHPCNSSGNRNREFAR